MTFFEYIKESNLVYYIYRSDLSIFDIPCTQESYFVVADPDFIVQAMKDGMLELYAEDYKYVIDNIAYTFVVTDKWFDMVLHNDIACWTFSCSKPKNVIKEHVKMIMQMDPIQIRYSADEYAHKFITNGNSRVEEGNRTGAIIQYYKAINVYNLANQIIECHKIVNYRESFPTYEMLNAYPIEDLYVTAMYLMEKPQRRIRQATDSLIYNKKLKQIQNEVNKQ